MLFPYEMLPTIQDDARMMRTNKFWIMIFLLRRPMTTQIIQESFNEQKWEKSI